MLHPHDLVMFQRFHFPLSSLGSLDFSIQIFGGALSVDSKPPGAWGCFNKQREAKTLALMEFVLLVFCLKICDDSEGIVEIILCYNCSC